MHHQAEHRKSHYYGLLGLPAEQAVRRLAEAGIPAHRIRADPSTGREAQLLTNTYRLTVRAGVIVAAHRHRHPAPTHAQPHHHRRPDPPAEGYFT